ncbi:MAG: class I SAM-dependent methyltransferase, partial [Candidatus Omnitrophica bacterium]|nr:class I SAM-dependent methyltransferase [Candidatus Omnitrophota bacterium]
ILFSLSNKNTRFFALDISKETVKKADIRQKEKGFVHRYTVADVRNLPFKSDVFDFILSSSTLDHFNSENELIKALLELKRVVKPVGSLIITLNNRCNVNFYLLLKLKKLFGLTAYPEQFYCSRQLKTIFQKVGLYIQGEDYSAHIISPVNSTLLLLRKFISKKVIDRIARGSVSFFRWLGKREKTKIFTGWFIALKCNKTY